MCVFSLIAQERIHQFAPNLARLCPETRKKFSKLTKLSSSSSGGDGQKLSMVEEYCQDQSCFKDEIMETDNTTPDNCSWFETR